MTCCYSQILAGISQRSVVLVIRSITRRPKCVASTCLAPAYAVSCRCDQHGGSPVLRRQNLSRAAPHWTQIVRPRSGQRIAPITTFYLKPLRRPKVVAGPDTPGLFATGASSLMAYPILEARGEPAALLTDCLDV